MEFLILFSVVALALAMLLTFLEFLFHLEEKKKEKINSKEINKISTNNYYTYNRGFKTEINNAFFRNKETIEKDIDNNVVNKTKNIKKDIKENIGKDLKQRVEPKTEERIKQRIEQNKKINNRVKIENKDIKEEIKEKTEEEEIIECLDEEKTKENLKKLKENRNALKKDVVVITEEEIQKEIENSKRKNELLEIQKIKPKVKNKIVEDDLIEFNFNITGSFLEDIQDNIYYYSVYRFANKLYSGLSDVQIKKEKLLNKKIYETPTYNIKLAYNTDIVFIKEKENIYDNKAIKVKINGIGTVGYVSKKSNQELTDIIDNNEIKEIIATVSGGKYKIFYSIVVNEFVEKYKIKILVKYKRGRLA